jgi:hypothetical protein
VADHQNALALAAASSAAALVSLFCQACPAGKYAPAPAVSVSAGCAVCGVGRYSPNDQALACEMCPAGR